MIGAARSLKASIKEFSESDRVTVYVVDGDPNFRRSISLLLHSVDLPAETFSTATEFLTSYDPRKPGCLVLEAWLRGMTGPELQQELQEQGIKLPIIFIAARGEISTATATLRAGAVDFLTKPFSRQLLLDRIHEALAINERQWRTAAAQQHVATRINSLTKREREVMRLLAEGVSTKSISTQLGISTKTVHNHQTKVFEKMSVDNAAQLLMAVAPEFQPGLEGA